MDPKFYYWRYIKDTNTPEKLAFDDCLMIMNIRQARETVNDWNRLSARYSGGRYLYWMD